MNPLQYSRALKSAKIKFSREEHLGFLSRIVDKPEESLGHDAYSDWLQDQGKDTHAEVIRRASRTVGFKSGQGPMAYNWNGSGESWHPNDFGVSAWKEPEGTWGLDLSSQHPVPLGETGTNVRRLWTLRGLPMEEAARLHAGLVGEGAGHETSPHAQIPQVAQQGVA